MDERPIFNDNPPSSRTEELSDQPMAWNAVSDCRIRVLLEKEKKVHLHIAADEPGDSLSIRYNAGRIKKLGLASVERSGTYIPADYPGEVSIIKSYQKMYE